MITYSWSTFNTLSSKDLYAILQLRQQVFVVEQNCPYLDADGLDQYAWHLLCRQNSPAARQLAGYLRIVYPGKKFTQPAIGRVLTTGSMRGRGIAAEMMRRAIDLARQHYPGNSLRISAQLHLKEYYQRFGFLVDSAPYDEDGIPHIEMVCPVGDGLEKL